ncbi:uncharacterized protein [Spinacia oleracea]|uniref:Reverse transcriptase domain-containing protein n=1 Tax=Spinacia oleracea TaxID=3562 RepID=A0ABM3RSL4_SPIOL|nr:uncharacterized protein LOC130472156 [Spinacia oleracea]
MSINVLHVGIVFMLGWDPSTKEFRKCWGVDLLDNCGIIDEVDGVKEACARRRKNYIHSLQDRNGLTVGDGPKLRHFISEFYLDLFEVHKPPVAQLSYDWSSLHLPSLSEASKDLLMLPFSAQDIRQAMFNIADNKSPGPDGFSAAFFKLHWNVVGDHIVHAIQFFFSHGFMLKDWNRTFLILLLKVLHPDSVSQFRPIGLCNVIYKCIAKCLTHRMQSVLPSLISDTQNAFVPGRLMSDECLIAHELMSYINRAKARKKFFAVVKLDMNKAYDRVRWDFLFQALQEFGFPPYWVHIIRQCITTVSYQVLVNGEPTRSFNPKCGMRQGDPLSPYLFVLCMEVFSALMRRSENDHLIQGISVCRGAPLVSQLFFADDSLLFFRVSPEVCDQVLSVLAEFSSLSGQVINYQKSFVKFSPNTPQDYRDYLASSLRLGQRPSLGPYLGVPVDIARKLANFSTLHLSSATKLVVINSVLVASITHVLSVFLIPKSICDRIDSLCLRFWWRSSAASRGMSMVPSSVIHLPKGMGGLGIQNISTFNQALLAKTAWRIVHHPQLLLSHFILDDVWVSNKLVSFKSSVNGLVCPTHVSSLLDLRSYAWNVGMIRRLFPDEISCHILALERPSCVMDDFMYWKFAPDGTFSVRSAYAMLLQTSHHTASTASVPSSLWWKHLWGMDVLPRFKLFLWKLLRHALPVAASLCQRGMPVDPLCSLCHQDSETITHLFRDCPLIVHLWSSGPLCSFSPSFSLVSFIPWCIQFVANLSSAPRGLLDVFISMLWTIWSLRNQARFRDTAWDPGAFQSVLAGWRIRCSEVRNLHRCVSMSQIRLRSSVRVAPIPELSPGSTASTGSNADVCLLSDGAWMSTSNNAGLGWVLQDPVSLSQVGGGAQACILDSALQAELNACLMGVQMEVRRGFSRILLYSDSSILVGLLTTSHPSPVSVIWMVQRLRDILHDLDWFSVRKVSRQLISPVHILATSARRRQLLRHSF